MKHSHPGKIAVHGEGIGQITAADIDRRAREIALIRNRESGNPEQDDLQQAKAELLGDNVVPTTNDDGASVGAMTRDPSDEPTLYAQPTPLVEDPDEQEVVEKLALDGVEEAQHDQMLAARKSPPSPL